MLFINSRGSIAIFAILGILIFAGATAGSVFLIKNNYVTNPFSAASPATEATQTKISTSSAATKTAAASQKAPASKPTAKPLETATTNATPSGKIYYLSYVQAEVPTLNTATPDFKNSQPFNTQLTSKFRTNETFASLGVSPDKSVTIIKTAGPIPENHSKYDVKSNWNKYYYLVYKNGEFKQIDFDKIVTPYVKADLHQYGTFEIFGFSSNGKKLIGSITLITWEGKYDFIVFDYDLTSGQIKELLKPDFTFDPYFYDSDKQIIAYQTSKPKEEQDDADPLNNVTGKLINLQDKTTVDFDDPTSNITASNQGGGLTNFINGNPYFIVTNKDAVYVPNGQTIGVTGYFDYKDRRNLWIKSFYNPTEKGYEVKLDAPQDLTYGRKVLWSPDFNYFAIEVHKNSTPKENTYLYIYSRLGKFIAKAETGLDDSLGYGAFSPDNRYLLVDRPLSRLPKDWMIFDLKEQKYIVKDVQPLGPALYWE